MLPAEYRLGRPASVAVFRDAAQVEIGGSVSLPLHRGRLPTEVLKKE